MRNKTVLITGGTGSLGIALVKNILNHHNPKKVIILSRDEHKQSEMKQHFNDLRVRYFVGDIRDKDRLYRAFKEVDYIIHTAAMKRVETCKYNPFEAIQTNIVGAQNIIDAAIDRKVLKVLAISTDKAVNPINLYGASKLCSDKLFLGANAYSTTKGTKFSVVRYGNFAGSRGSVIPKFIKLTQQGIKKLPVTDRRMTRFFIKTSEAAEFAIQCLENMMGEEIYIPKMTSRKIIDVAMAVNPEAEIYEIGHPVGEKLHEDMILETDAPRTVEFPEYYITFPSNERGMLSKGARVSEGFSYNSKLTK